MNAQDLALYVDTMGTISLDKNQLKIVPGNRHQVLGAMTHLKS